MGVIEISAPLGNGRIVEDILLGSPALGNATVVMAAFTDNAKYNVFYRKTVFGSRLAATKVTATARGVAGDIKAVQVIVTGTDSAGAPLTETLPVFTVNTSTTVTSVGSFKTVTSITIPAHDGTGAITTLGFADGLTDEMLSWTDVGADAVHTAGATITNPAVCRNLTATSAGTAGDIGAIQVIVHGTSLDGLPASETLPIFTANSGTTVVGAYAFKAVDSIEIPVHDGTGATTSIGTGAKLGMPYRMTRFSLLRLYFNNVAEAASAFVVDGTDLYKNTVTTTSALNGSPVRVAVYQN